MTRGVVAVYDDSEEYIGRLAAYVNQEKEAGFELIGFSEAEALAQFLEGRRVDILLFSMEALLEEAEDREAEYDRFLSHSNVREFVYFGERRNSRTTLRHINKYQSADRILEELRKILQEGIPAPLADEAALSADGIELVGIYAPGGENGMSMTALQIAEMKSARKQVLFVDMDRFSLVADYLHVEPGSGITDLLFYYKTNRQKLSECLCEKKTRCRSIDFLAGPESLEDMNELAEHEWPDFFRTVAKSGGYETVVIYMAEAFRNLEGFLEACREIYTPMTKEEMSGKKMERFTAHLCGKGRRDLIERSERICVRKGDSEWSLQRN